MTPRNSSTIAQLLFTATPDVDLARIANDLDGALSKCAPSSRRMSWDHEDLALLDVQGSRLVMSLASGLPGQHAACLTVSVGYGPAQRKSTSLAQRQGAICQMIADRVSSRYPADDLRWHKGPAIVTSDVIDRLTDALDSAPTPLDEVVEKLNLAIRTPALQAAQNTPDLPRRITLSLRGRAMRVVMGLRALATPQNSGFGLPA